MIIHTASYSPREPVSTSFTDWLAASRRGSADDLGQLLESSRAYLLAVAEVELGSTLRPKAGASDLVQESLLEAHQWFDRFHGATREDFLAWASTILRRNLVDLARRYRTSEARAVGREEPQVGAEALPGDTGSPPDHASLDEETARLNRAVGRLPEETRVVIRLRYEDQLAWDEIARRLGKSAEAVRKIWFRAVERLRDQLGGTDDGRG